MCEGAKHPNLNIVTAVVLSEAVSAKCFQDCNAHRCHNLHCGHINSLGVKMDSLNCKKEACRVWSVQEFT